MMKFFRLYTKQLLAIFMALLLVVWLAGDALTTLMRSHEDVGKQVRGTAYGETIRLRDMWPAFHESETLTELGMPYWQAPWYVVIRDLNVQNGQQYAQAVRQTLLTNEEWYMLNAAAEKAHIHVPATAVEDFKNKAGLTPDLLNQIAQRSRKSMEEIDNAVRSFLRVREAAVQAVKAFKVSDADINVLIRQTGEKAKITAVVLENASFVDNNYQPTPQEIQAQFDKFKNIASRPSEAGYEEPQTSQVEYIEIASDALARNQKVSDDEAYDYWSKHQNEFMKPASQPATATAPAPQAKPYTTFSEARAKVIAKLVKERADAEALRLGRELIARLQLPWAKVTTTRPTDAKTAPESEKSPTLYTKLVEELQARHPGAFKYGRLEPLAQDQLTTQPAGSANALANSEMETSVAEAAMLVPGLEKSADPKSARFYRGLYETAAEPFVGANGNVFVMRTVAVKPKQAPASLDSVRSRIVTDIRNTRALEEARKAAQKLSELAAQKGLEAAIDSDPVLKLKLGPAAVKHPQPFAQTMLITYFGPPQLYPGSIPGIGSPPELVDKLFALSAKTTTQPSKVAMVEDPKQQRFVIAQLDEILPVTREEYSKQRAAAMQIIETQGLVGALQQWFSPEQIKARVSWADAEKPKDTEETAEKG